MAGACSLKRRKLRHIFVICGWWQYCPANNMVSAIDRPATSLEIVIGQTLAGLRHPIAAWRTMPAFRRLVCVSTCFAASYVMVFLALRLLS